MTNYQRVPCTCVSSYCCACSCDYNDLVDEIVMLREINEGLQAKINDLMSKECLKMSTDYGLDIRKTKADAIRDALPHGLTESGLSMKALLDYADEIESGE